MITLELTESELRTLIKIIDREHSEDGAESSGYKADVHFIREKSLKLQWEKLYPVKSK